MLCNGYLQINNHFTMCNLFRTALRDIFSFLTVSSLWIAGLGFFKIYMAYIFLDVPPSYSVCFTVFLIAFSVYSLDKIVDMEDDITNMPQRQTFLSKRRKLVLYCAIFAYLTAIMLTLLDKPLSIPLIFIPLIANAFYGTKLLPGVPRLKDIPVMKNVVVATTWAMIITLLPAIHMGLLMPKEIALVFYFMIVKTFIDTVLYDIRDVLGDRENGVRTMPVLLGKWRTVITLLIINSTLLPWLVFAGSTVRPLALLLTIYGYMYILYFREKKNPYALDLVVEGEWMLASMLVLILELVGLMG